MNIDRLRVFRTVARSPTFAAAAHELSFTPSAVSQQMARLEREVGTTLVERTPRGLRLTAAGTTLLARADEIVALIGTAAAEVRALTESEQGVVRLGATRAIAQTVGIRVLNVYRHRHRGAPAHLVEGDSDELVARARHGEVDLALVLHDDSGDRSGIAVEPVFYDAVTVVVAEGHPLAQLRAVTPARLGAHTIVNAPTADGMLALARVCDEQGVQLRFAGHDLSDFQSARAFVAAGMGVAVMPRLATAIDFPGTVALPVTGVPPVAIAIARPTQRAATPAVEAMLAVIGELTTEAKVAALAA